MNADNRVIVVETRANSVVRRDEAAKSCLSMKAKEERGLIVLLYHVEVPSRPCLRRI